MNCKVKRALALSLALLMSLALAGCGEAQNATLNGTADNEILTFQNNAENKPVVRIGTSYYSPDNQLINALQEKFPDYLFVEDHWLASGMNAEQLLLEGYEREMPFDLVVGGRSNYKNKDIGYCVDLSAERFLEQYLLSSLNNISVDEHIYFLPGISSLTGIAYNTEMFAEHGWKVPTNIEELFALCAEIQEAGIRPISHCFKYASQLNTNFGTMLYDQLYLSPGDSAWINQVQTGEATYAGHMEPFYELAERYYDEGLASLDDFSASLTKQRQAFWEGECAMIFYNSTIFTYAETENAPFEVGIMPFPAENSENSGYSITPEYYISIPKTVERDPERLALMKEILAFISTPEGQRALLFGSLSVSNIKGVTMTDNPAYEYMAEAYEKGNLYTAVTYSAADFDMLTLQQESIQSIFEGSSAEDALAMMDDSIQKAVAEGGQTPEYEVVAVAEEDFSVLETSYYFADKLREASGADIGLIINGGYFRANLYSIGAGEITSNTAPYIMKGVDGDDFLTTYKMTGAQLRQLIEHPIVNDEEIDVLIASSGLKIEYAPWNERGSRILALTLEDGTELAEDQLYTVAAWAGVIDEQYITETVEVHDDLGAYTDIVLAAFKRDGVIKPDIADRVTLVWPEMAG